QPRPRSTLFPYTTLFRSASALPRMRSQLPSLLFSKSHLLCCRIGLLFHHRPAPDVPMVVTGLVVGHHGLEWLRGHDIRQGDVVAAPGQSETWIARLEEVAEGGQPPQDRPPQFE